MRIIDLLEFIQDEKRSEDFLRSGGILKTFTHCYKYNSSKFGMTRSAFLKDQQEVIDRT